MRILIDLQACQSSGSRLAGIGRYSWNLLEALSRHCGPHELRILLNDRLPESLPGLYRQLQRLLPREQVQLFRVPGPVMATNPENVAPLAELVYENMVQRFNPDIIHVSSLFEGLDSEAVASVGRLLPGERTSVTLYDLIPLLEEKHYLVDTATRSHYFRKLESLRRSGSLLAISEYSRQEVIDELGFPAERVTNIAAGVDARFCVRNVSLQDAAALRNKYGVTGKFLLFVGNFDYRKNHSRLIDAFACLPSSVRQQYQLVIVGNGWYEKYEELRAVGQRAGLEDSALVFAGRVDDEDLLLFYALADLFVFPSLREGYGLPVLEAMACGTPTIASNTTSIPEVVGWSDALFDPSDTDSIAAKMHQGLTDSGFREQLRSRGLTQSRLFTWDATAKAAMAAFEAQYARTRDLPRISTASLEKQTLAAVQELTAAPTPEAGQSRQELVAAALFANARCLVELQPEKPRIGWVTTWNSPCGIAMYAHYLAGVHLPDYTIFAPHLDNPVFPDACNVVRCWQAEQKSLTELAWQVRQHGIDILLVQFQFGFFDFDALRTFLQEMIGAGLRLYIVFHATSDQPPKSLSSLVDWLALSNALLVHSPHDEDFLASLGLTENVERFPHGVVDVSPAAPRLVIPPGRFILATYGFFLPHKGLLEMLEAAEELCLRGWDIHLVMINARYPVEVSDELIDLAEQRCAAGPLHDRVTLVTDFLDDAVSLGYLCQAELIVYPYQKTAESSSAALRMGLAAGRPVVGTPLAIFDDLRHLMLTLSGTHVLDIVTGLEELMPRVRHPAGDQEIQEISSRAAEWRAANSYSHLSDVLWQKLVGQRQDSGTDTPISHNSGE